MSDANAVVGAAEGRVGQLLCGKWRLDRLLGVGGMGAVYAARHVRNQSRVAVKILHRQSQLSPERVARLQREGYVANRVAHPGVPAVFDDDIDETGCAFLVLELLTGQSVAQRALACGGRLSTKEVLELADGVLDVLRASHASSILHRDIKPDNLFITDDGSLKVLDFGIARLCDPEFANVTTENGTLLGAPAFLAPEQARGRIDELDERTDLWALGATMFTLVTGRYVHEAKTPNEQLGLAMSVPAPSLARVAPQLPRTFTAIIDRALAFDAADRWPDAHAMQQAVRAALGSARESQKSSDVVLVAPTHKNSKSALATVSTRRPLALSDGTEPARVALSTFFWKPLLGLGVIGALLSLSLLGLRAERSNEAGGPPPASHAWSARAGAGDSKDTRTIPQEPPRAAERVPLVALNPVLNTPRPVKTARKARAPKLRAVEAPSLAAARPKEPTVPASPSTSPAHEPPRDPAVEADEAPAARGVLDRRH